MHREARSRETTLAQREEQLKEGEQILVTLSARLINEQEELEQKKKAASAAQHNGSSEMEAQVCASGWRQCADACICR